MAKSYIAKLKKIKTTTGQKKLLNEWLYSWQYVYRRITKKLIDGMERHDYEYVRQHLHELETMEKNQFPSLEKIFSEVSREDHIIELYRHIAEAEKD